VIVPRTGLAAARRLPSAVYSWSVTSPLHAIAALGQSIWSDQLSRSMLTSGELARLVDEDAVTGVTSNPTIFAGAITGSDDYADQLGEMSRRGADTVEIVTALMTQDIQGGCDVLRPVWERTGGGDGFVSVEVSPDVANDTEATIAEARDWVKKVDRPNLYVKVPATPAGVPAIRRLIGEGISINVTLIFSLDRYRDVMDAYLTGLDEYRASGGRLDGITSVASFFVSRFDTEVDPRLERIGTPEALELRGQMALANARAAYGDFLDKFRGERWTLLQAAGARLQRPLWASTSTKNPNYPDTKYVDALVQKHTVDTMPLETIAAVKEHGNPHPRLFGEKDIAEARGILRGLADVGIEYGDVVQTLEDQGVEKFAASWREVVDDVDQARKSG
jgi:transaldolase